MANDGGAMMPGDLIQKIRRHPESVGFDEVMSVISEYYDYVDTRFTNGFDDDRVVNEAGSNAGSCRIFAFGQLHGLSEPEVLACFGTYYRDDVLGHPDGVDHANIRAFIRHGWAGIGFDSKALQPR